MRPLGVGALGRGFGRLGAIGGPGAPVVFDPDAEILFAAMTPEPVQARKIVINTLIVALKAAGVWALCDILYVLAAHASQPATLNWKAPGSFTASPVGSPTFTVDRGFNGDGVGAYLAPGWSPSTNAVQLQLDSAHISGWSLSSVVGSNTERLIGTATGLAPHIQILPRSVANATAIRVNDGTPSAFANANGDGFFVANRSASNARQAYRNGTLLGQDAIASTGLSASAVTFLRDSTNFATLQIACGSAGGSLTEPQADAFYAALLAYMQAVGAQP